MRLRHLLLLQATACTVGFDDLGDTTVTCNASAECPAGWECATTLGRCVPGDTSDRQAPDLADVSLTPAVARAGQTVVVAIEASEPLGVAPGLSLAPVELERGSGASMATTTV